MLFFNGIIIQQNPGEIIKIWNGGIAIHGALLVRLLTAIVFAQSKEIIILEACGYCGSKSYYWGKQLAVGVTL